MKITNVGEGKVMLLAGGGKVFTDVAARFVRSERDLESIVGSDYDKKLVETILNSGHLAATEFDYFIFAVEGYSRVTETQLVRKRHASFCIKSGRANKKGKRSYDVVMPKNVMDFKAMTKLNPKEVSIRHKDGHVLNLGDVQEVESVEYMFTGEDLLYMMEDWYNDGVVQGLPEEDLRYGKPQATEFKAIIGMNAHALFDFFNVRTCECAQTEIRHMAKNMLKLCREVAPDLFRKAGPNCVKLGYCPEGKFMAETCKKNKKLPTKDIVDDLIRKWRADTFCPAPEIKIPIESHYVKEGIHHKPNSLTDIVVPIDSENEKVSVEEVAENVIKHIKVQNKN